MRLTLRTMLAFMDDVLEGPDATALGQKIDESKFASDLVHRIRSSVRRLRLGAPKVDGKGMGAEANTVAEYLDNTMPPEQVPEFEKVCLESDVQLAEVAACHQILTIVLGEAASVEPATRDRMYRIGHPETAPAPSAAPQGGNGTAAARGAVLTEAQAVPSNQPRVESDPGGVRPASQARTTAVPTDSAFPFTSLAITLLLGFVVAGVALRAIHPFDSEHPLWRLWFSARSGTSEVAQQPLEVPSAAAQVPTAEVATPPAPIGTTKPPAEPPAEAITEPSLPKEPVTTTVADPPVAAPPVSVPPVSVPPVSVPPGSAPAAAPPGPGEPTEVAPTKPVPAANPANVSAVATSPVTKPVLEPNGLIKPPEVASIPVTIARYISEEQVLARLDPAKSAWMALPANSSLVAGEQILSLPTYRPQILIAPNIKMTLAGEAFVKLHIPEAANVPRVTIDFGRAILVPVGETGNVIQIDFAGRSGQLVFADLESSVALEVRPYLPPGADPVAGMTNVVVQMWAISGGAEWREPDREPLTLLAGQRAQFIDEDSVAIVAGQTLPDWREGKNLTDIERRASQELRKFLTEDRPLALSLMEHTNYRQVEVRALACRCLCYMDIFEPAVAALGDSQHKSYWPWHMGAIQSTLAFGPATVEKLYADIDRLHNQDTEVIIRLIRGYSPEQLTAGGAAELVGALENKSMTIRVLAFLTLHRIADKTHLFHPEDRPDQERASVLKWRKTLEDGQISYKSPPTPLPPIVPVAPDESTK